MATFVDTSGGVTLKNFIGSGSDGIIGILNTIVVPIIFALIFAVFVWGIVQYFILSQGNDTKLAEGRKFAIWGILGIVVLLSVWGVINLLLSTLGISN